MATTINAYRLVILAAAMIFIALPALAQSDAPPAEPSRSSDDDHSRRGHSTGVGIDVDLNGLFGPHKKTSAKPEEEPSSDSDDDDDDDGPKPHQDTYNVDNTLLGCCGCVDKLELILTGGAPREAKTVINKQNGEESRDIAAQYGHSFTLRIYFHYKKRTDASEPAGGELSLEWLERMDRPNSTYKSAGIEKDTWANIPEVLLKANIIDNKTQGTFGPWLRRKKCIDNCPLPPDGIKLSGDSWPVITMHDSPAAHVGSSRVTDFDIIVHSAKGCDCAHQALEVKAQQDLQGDSDHASFFDPSGKRMSWNDNTKNKVTGTDPPAPPAAANAPTGTPAAASGTGATPAPSPAPQGSTTPPPTNTPAPSAGNSPGAGEH